MMDCKPSSQKIVPTILPQYKQFYDSIVHLTIIPDILGDFLYRFRNTLGDNIEKDDSEYDLCT